MKYQSEENRAPAVVTLYRILLAVILMPFMVNISIVIVFSAVRLIFDGLRMVVDLSFSQV